jgi:hypothetical protein
MSLDPLTPVRLGIGATRLGLRIGVEVAKLPLRILSGLLGNDDDDFEAPAPRARRAAKARPPEPAPDEPPPAPVSVAEAERPYHPAYEAEVAPEPEPEPPAHVDDEPELVAEFADSGAGEGAGAELHVDEPWEGYGSLTADAIKNRISAASTAELAVIQLYEATHRSRRSVIEAVERRSKQLANEPHPGSRPPRSAG